MHDLRRQALESRKTVSRKAQSKQSSRASSRPGSEANSRSQSRNPSRPVSDDDEGELSDATSWSVTSIDEMLAVGDLNGAEASARSDLSDVLDRILDRKRSSVAGREGTLATFNRLATANYVGEGVREKHEELVGALLRSITSRASEREAMLALRALGLITISHPSDAVYDATRQALKETITDCDATMIKSAALHALGVVTFYGGASTPEVLSVMDFLLEIIGSDGYSVGAADLATVVTAALEEWGFLATQIDDLEQESPVAMDPLMDQLESTDANVQVAAGENIALLFEKSFTEREQDESSADEDDDDDDDDEAESDPSPGGPRMVKRYDPCRDPGQLKHRLSRLASISSRRLSKRDKRSLHTNFADILNSVQNPTRGPRYQNAVNQETGKRYGSRMVLRVHRTGVMKIDRWWKLHRLRALRRTLGGGFLVHYERNEVVFESLPYVGIPILFLAHVSDLANSDVVSRLVPISADGVVGS